MDDPTPAVTEDAERGQVSTAAAEVYEAFFVPALFGQFTDRVLDHAGVRSGDRVLDVGCGTGIVARRAQQVVGPGGHVAALDPNDGMLAVARRADPTIAWRRGVAEAIPAADRSFDRTISQFAAMFFTDRAAALREMARATVDGGTVTIATWSRLDQQPGYHAMVSLIADVIGGDAADALRAPFAFGEVDEIRQLVGTVGTDVRIDVATGTARFPSLADWIRTEVRGWTLSTLVDDDAESALVARAARATSDLARFVRSDGSVDFPSPAIVATAVVAAVVAPTGASTRHR